MTEGQTTSLANRSDWYHIQYNKEEDMAITTSEARRDLFGLIERVNLDHTEVEITSKRGSAVLMSKEEYDALVETTHLLRSPKNAQRLLSSLSAVRDGQVTEHELTDR